MPIRINCYIGCNNPLECNIAKAALNQGWESYISYGRYSNPSQSKLIKIGSQLDVYTHYAEQRVWDNEGLSSRSATKKLIAQIKEINPDVVQLHNIHDRYLNYRILFEYLNSTNIQVVWTFHDCWAFTDYCFHFVTSKYSIAF